MIIINFKTYKQGKQVLELAKTIEKYNKKAIIAVQPTDIKNLAEKTNLQIYSQHTDGYEKGRNTGFIIPEAIKNAGAKGTLLNHSEHKITLNQIKQTIGLCKKFNLKVICCVNDLKEANKIKKLYPYGIAFEPSNLIATGKSITEYKELELKRFINLLMGSKIIPICGAGISSKKDIIKAKELGCKGILISSAITKGKKEKIKEMLI